jgi:hypothetical protein
MGSDGSRSGADVLSWLRAMNPGHVVVDSEPTQEEPRRLVLVPLRRHRPSEHRRKAEDAVS